ncbi:kinase-like domain-containing protein [Pavlovales sp. CCMP2436]|nr:kinase-like domain-containing protein [Pavlovales sp. CCMP2436]
MKLPMADAAGWEVDSAGEDTNGVDGISPLRRPLDIDDFQVLSKLGEGGFGTVLLVRKRSNGKLFALKLLVKRHMTRSEDAQRAISESLAMQEIRHPFIVRLHYAFQVRVGGGRGGRGGGGLTRRCGIGLVTSSSTRKALCTCARVAVARDGRLRDGARWPQGTWGSMTFCTPYLIVYLDY